MGFYTDDDPETSNVMCIAPEDGGLSFCGNYHCHNEITANHVDSIWELFRNDLICSSCDCRDNFRAYLGFEDEGALERFFRRRRANHLLNEKRQEANP